MAVQVVAGHGPFNGGAGIVPKARDSRAEAAVPQIVALVPTGEPTGGTARVRNLHA